jgi:hypothetical protein
MRRRLPTIGRKFFSRSRATMHANDAVVASESVKITAHGCHTNAELTRELRNSYPTSIRDEGEDVRLSLCGQ